MAIALEKEIYMYHKNNPLQTTFYHLPEVNTFQGEMEEFVSYVMNKGDASLLSERVKICNQTAKEKSEQKIYFKIKEL